MSGEHFEWQNGYCRKCDWVRFWITFSLIQLLSENVMKTTVNNRLWQTCKVWLTLLLFFLNDQNCVTRTMKNEHFHEVWRKSVFLYFHKEKLIFLYFNKFQHVSESWVVRRMVFQSNYAIHCISICFLFMAVTWSR